MRPSERPPARTRGPRWGARGALGGVATAFAATVGLLAATAGLLAATVGLPTLAGALVAASAFAACWLAAVGAAHVLARVLARG